MFHNVTCLFNDLKNHQLTSNMKKETNYRGVHQLFQTLSI